MVRRLVLCFVALCAVSVVSAQQLKLVVAGDGRSSGNSNPPRPEDQDGINVVITAEMRDAVLKEGAKALLWTGDLVLGSDKPDVLQTQLSAWMKIMQPLWDQHVQVLAVRGNHEAYNPDSMAIWRKTFSGAYALPANGPAGAEGLSYSATIDNVLILGLDQYVYASQTSPIRWLNDTIAKNKQPHIFAFGHEMAFMAGNHMDNLSVNAKNRDDFINGLIRAGSQAFFAGHDHFYDHLIATNETGSIHQFVAGTAGAPWYKDRGYTQANPGWTTTRVLHLPKTNEEPVVYGYLLIEIDGLKATVTFKGRTAPGQYEAMDTFTYVAK